MLVLVPATVIFFLEEEKKSYKMPVKAQKIETIRIDILEMVLLSTHKKHKKLVYERLQKYSKFGSLWTQK
jgi:hypothetical protein